MIKKQNCCGIKLGGGSLNNYIEGYDSKSDNRIDPKWLILALGCKHFQIILNYFDPEI